MSTLIPHYFRSAPQRRDCIWCKDYVDAPIHNLNTIEAVEKALDEAREEGRREIRDRVNALLDEYAPTSVGWWQKINTVLQPAWWVANNTKA